MLKWEPLGSNYNVYTQTKSSEGYALAETTDANGNIVS